MTKIMERSIETLTIMVSKHFRNHRLCDLELNTLNPEERNAAMTATLDHFEREVARQKRIKGDDRKRAANGASG